MTVKTGQAWAGLFVTLDATGALATPSVGPVGALYVNGVANAASVTITGSNPYKFAVTLPTLTAGQRVDMYITATISTIATASVVASEQADTLLVSDVVGADSDTLETLSDQLDAVALEATLTDIKGAGWSDETLKAIKEAVDAITSIDEAGVRNAVGLAAANLDTQLSAIPSESSVYDGKTYEELIKLTASALLGLLSRSVDGTTLTFRDLLDTKDRIVTTQNPATGERTNQTLDGS